MNSKHLILALKSELSVLLQMDTSNNKTKFFVYFLTSKSISFVLMGSFRGETGNYTEYYFFVSVASIGSFREKSRPKIYIF